MIINRFRNIRVMCSISLWRGCWFVYLKGSIGASATKRVCPLNCEMLYSFYLNLEQYMSDIPTSSFCSSIVWQDLPIDILCPRPPHCQFMFSRKRLPSSHANAISTQFLIQLLKWTLTTFPFFYHPFLRP